MNKAKVVMFFYAIAALFSMFFIGFSASFIFMSGPNEYVTEGIIGMIIGAILTIAIFGFGMVQKGKYRRAGLL